MNSPENQVRHDLRRADVAKLSHLPITNIAISAVLGVKRCVIEYDLSVLQEKNIPIGNRSERYTYQDAVSTLGKMYRHEFDGEFSKEILFSLTNALENTVGIETLTQQLADILLEEPFILPPSLKRTFTVWKHCQRFSSEVPAKRQKTAICFSKTAFIDLIAEFTKREQPQLRYKNDLVWELAYMLAENPRLATPFLPGVLERIPVTSAMTEPLNTVIATLAKDDFAVFSLYFPITGNGKTLEEIGELLGMVTKERIRQRLLRACKHVFYLMFAKKDQWKANFYNGAVNLSRPQQEKPLDLSTLLCDNLPIDDLVKNALANAGISTIAELAALSRKQILEIKNLRTRKVGALIAALATLGVKIAEDSP